MKTYTISSECGLMDICAASVGAAKEIYERERHYDFDAVLLGSWYWIAEDGLRIEEQMQDAPVRHGY